MDSRLRGNDEECGVMLWKTGIYFWSGSKVRSLARPLFVSAQSPISGVSKRNALSARSFGECLGGARLAMCFGTLATEALCGPCWGRLAFAVP